jgi:hypothetical protein
MPKRGGDETNMLSRLPETLVNIDQFLKKIERDRLHFKSTPRPWLARAFCPLRDSL